MVILSLAATAPAAAQPPRPTDIADQSLAEVAHDPARDAAGQPVQVSG